MKRPNQMLVVCLLSGGLVFAPACSDASSPPCERPCQPGFECQFIDGGPLTRCVALPPKPCEPACGAGEVCTELGVCVVVGGDDSCAEILECIGGCAANDACATDCEKTGSAGARSALAALRACLAEHSCSDASCTQQHCAPELSACLEGPCGGVDSVGQCEGDVLSYCESDVLKSGDCRTVGADCSCAFDAARGFFDCLCPDAQCIPPCLQGQVCVEGMCRVGP